ncbi:hypothetical protein SKAU_G00384330 [Synaphobranchus kaupii]|uniref:Uncharacterized protein n=1 Tax=Synaphobranchus kaupii TaxID=118154 RepID=A0A9Q1ICY6_SYNKA|nr:hypothetical protein SKAU_G00384330 [Synaphobranchus kaupii]
MPRQHFGAGKVNTVLFVFDDDAAVPRLLPPDLVPHIQRSSNDAGLHNVLCKSSDLRVAKSTSLFPASDGKCGGITALFITQEQEEALGVS